MFQENFLFVTGGSSPQETVERLGRKSKLGPRFNEIFLSGVSFDDEALVDAIFHVMQDNQYIGLHLAQCRHMNKLLEKCFLQQSDLCIQKFSVLNGSGFESIPADTCRVLGECIAQSKHLESFTVRAFLSGDLAKSLQNGLIHNQTIQELSIPVISGSSLESIQHLASGLQQASKLERLKMNQNDSLVYEMEASQMNTLMQALEHHGSLRELRMQATSCGQEGVHAIARLLVANSPHLTKLNLSSNKNNKETVPNIHVLAQALTQNSHLRSLSLAGHTMTEDDIQHLGTALSSSSAGGLQELCLNNCDMDDSMAAVLASLIPNFSSLQSLSLRENPFRERGAKALLKSLQRNQSLRQLLIPQGCPASKSVQLEIECCLLLKIEGDRLLQKKDGIPLSMWPMILSKENTTRLELEYFGKETARTESIFHLLREGALLLETC
jgi:hypothetical protein